MVVVGIDPGTAITGYAFLEEKKDQSIQLISCGVIRTDAAESQEIRLQKLYFDLRKLLTTYNPKGSAVEMLFFQKNVRTALSVGQARGVILLALAEAKIPVAEYNPLEIKQAVTGYGGAEKVQVQKMVQILLGLSTMPTPDDAADALAVALCHLHSRKFKTLQTGDG